MNKGETTKLLIYPRMITFIGAIAMLAMLILPFATATDDYKERLMDNPEQMYAEEIGMTNAGAVNVSLYEYARMYIEVMDQESLRVVSIVCLVIIGAFAGFAVLTLLMALVKKPIGIAIFDLLTIGVFRVICFDFEDRGVIPGSKYDWGIVSTLTYIIGVAIFVGAIWLFIEKRKARKVSEK